MRFQQLFVDHVEKISLLFCHCPSFHHGKLRRVFENAVTYLDQNYFIVSKSEYRYLYLPVIKCFIKINLLIKFIINST